MNRVRVMVIGFCVVAWFGASAVAAESRSPAQPAESAGVAKLAVPEVVLKAEAERIAVMAKVKPAVVCVFDPKGQGGGSGVLLSPDGYAITNFHVVQPCGMTMKCGLSDGHRYDAVLVGLDPVGDVALIKLLGRDDFPHAELADSDKVRTGDHVFAMGNPFLLATNLQVTATYGMISGTHRYQFPEMGLLEYTDCFQTDASINPGNSGGPLFNMQGQVVGINGRCSFDKRGRVSVGVGYSISSNQIRNFLGSLHSGRILDHASLGAIVDDQDGHVVVTQVSESSDASRRGLQEGDELISFGGREIASANAFKNMLGVFPKGWRVPMSFRHGDERHDVLVRLGGIHEPADLLKKLGGEKEGQMPGPRPSRCRNRNPNRTSQRITPRPIPRASPKRGRAHRQ